MKHTKEYLDSKYVSDNPDKYDMRHVIEARKYIRAYEDGMKLASDGDLADVITRNWFERLPLYWRYVWYMVGGILIGLLLPYVW